MTEYQHYHSDLILRVKILVACFLFVLSIDAFEIKKDSFCLAPQSQVYRLYEPAPENQTSFFRDYESLFVLFEETLDKVLESRNERFRQTSEKEPVLIHSAGASDFKEAYSVIMTMYEHYEKYPEKWGVYTPKDVFVQASDISSPMVFSGIQGAYTESNIFSLEIMLMAQRGWNETEIENFKKRFFNKVIQENLTLYVIKPEYKKNIIPRWGNLMDSDLHPPKADIILYNTVWSTSSYEFITLEILASLKQFAHSFSRNNGGYLITNSTLPSLPKHLRKQGELDFYDVYFYTADPSGIDEEHSCSMTRYIEKFI